MILNNYCLLCNLACQDNSHICHICTKTLLYHKPGCKRCGCTIDQHNTTYLCGKCIEQPPAFDELIALFDYQEPIISCIHQLKFLNNLTIGRWFATQWVKQLHNKTHHPDVILPVPLHYKRLAQRGFNQTLEIAKPIGKQLQIRIDRFNCHRIKNTQAQSQLSVKKRTTNIKNAFKLKKNITGRHIAILDDVVTTGNTASELAYLLKQHGAEKITIWCCARA